MPIEICVPKGSEFWDSSTNLFYTLDKDVKLVMEHSLVSIHKWEQRYHKPFLDPKNQKKTRAEQRYYLECMTLTKTVDPIVYKMIPRKELIRLKAYIEDPMTATTYKPRGKPGRPEIKTAEVLYADMIMLGIPFECRKWHLNTLIMLIRTCADRQIPQKNMSRSEILAQNRELNRLRKKAWHTKG
jgi:hypothetical protein